MLLLEDLVKNKYKHIIFVGCVADQFSNMIKHFFNFKEVENVVEETKEVIKEINGHSKLHAVFKQMKESDEFDDVIEMSLFSSTRFAGSVLMMETLVKALTLLRLMASDSELEVTESTKMKLLSLMEHKDFIGNLKQVIS